MTYITTQEVASKLGCSEETIRNMIHEGKIPALRLDRTYRMDWLEVQRALSVTTNTINTGRP